MNSSNSATEQASDPSKVRVFVDPESNLKWLVCVVCPGDAYGIQNSLIHKDELKMGNLIEFYDVQYANPRFSDRRNLGQFVSRYYQSTLIESEQGQRPATQTGLCLDGSVERWNVSSQMMKEVMSWINHQFPQSSQSSQSSNKSQVQQLKDYALENYESGGHWIYESFDESDYEEFLTEGQGDLAKTKQLLEDHWAYLEATSKDINSM